MSLLNIAKSAGSLLVGGVQLVGKATYEGGKYAIKEAERLSAEKQPEVEALGKEINLDIAKMSLKGARALQELSEKVAEYGTKRVKVSEDK